MSLERQIDISLLVERIQHYRNERNYAALSKLLPIVRCSFEPSKYERILMTQLRDRNTATKEFRVVSQKIGNLLVGKAVECLISTPVKIETPLIQDTGESVSQFLELVSIMRSGDALLDTFFHHFPGANVSKILIQRDESTATPQFKYMKLSRTIASGNQIIVTEPMIATGGTLEMVISLLKDSGVKEEKIIVASICAAPEGLALLNHRFPHIQVVMTVLDQKLNEKKYILPGIGDFGDRYFGTNHE